MFGSQAIDIGPGLVFICFVLSVICFGVNEMLAGLCQSVPWVRRRKKKKRRR